MRSETLAPVRVVETLLIPEADGSTYWRWVIQLDGWLWDQGSESTETAAQRALNKARCDLAEHMRSEAR